MKSDSTTTTSSKEDDLLEDYVLSKSYASADGEAVRSMCVMESSVASTDEDKSPTTTSTTSLLVVGSQGGWMTTYVAATTTATMEPVHSFQGGHSHAITALISYERDTLVSGCKDAIIRVFRLSCTDLSTNHGRSTNTPSSTTQLLGHTNAVTSFSPVHFTPPSASSSTSTPIQPFLLSGSWDGTAKLWNARTTTTTNTTNDGCLTTLEGHENTVCVQGLPPSTSTYTNHGKHHTNNGSDTKRQYYFATVATGSAGIAHGNVISEMKLRLWDLTLVVVPLTAAENTQPSYSCTATLRTYITDHLGPIRGLSYNPTNHYFVSISNDGSMKLRDSSTGTTLQSFQHSTTSNATTDIPPLLLTVTAIGPTTFVTGTEDGYAYLWNTNHQTPQQIILHPNTIWQVLPYSAPMPTYAAVDGEDFMTACHDGFVRVFTKSKQRMASPEDIHTFTTQVQTAAAARTGSSSTSRSSGGGPSREEIFKLPHWENRYQKAGKSEGQIQLFQKLQPEGDDYEPYAIAAQWTSGTWIEVGQVVGSNQNTNQQPQKQEMIDGTHYDYVIPIEVDTPTSGTLHLQIGYNTGDNPFVVAQQFIDQHHLDQHYLAQIADYIRERTAPKKPTMLGDPSSHVVHQQGQAEQYAAKPKTISSSLQYLPMKSFLLFDSGTDKNTMHKIFSKLKEIHVVVSNSNSGSSNDTEDLLVLERLVTTIGATNRYHASIISKEELTLLSRWISTWPLEHVFPVLDLIRLVVLHPDASNVQKVDLWQGVIQATLDKCNELLGIMDVESGAATPTNSSVSVAIPMLSMRLFANSFKGSGSSSAIASHLDSIFQVATQFVSRYSMTNKNVRLSLVTMALNASTYVHNAASPMSSIHSLPLEALVALNGVIFDSYVTSYPTEELTILRVVLALGTVVLLLKSQGVMSQEVVNPLITSISSSTRTHLVSIAKESSSYGSKVQAVAKEIVLVLDM